MSTVTAPARRVKVSVGSTDVPQVVSARTAGGIIRRAKYVACYVTTGEGGTADVLDISKRRVLRLLRRRDRVWLSDLFGTVVVGRPEPAKSSSYEPLFSEYSDN